MTTPFLPDRRSALKAAALAAVAGLTGCDSAAPPPAGDLAATGTPPPVTDPKSLRAKAIRETATAIRAECQRNAGGDWAKWQEMTAGYRAAVAARSAAAKPFNPKNDKPYFEGKASVLAAIDDFELIECVPTFYLRFMSEPGLFAQAEVQHKVTAAHRWLKQRGVDLIFVLAPKMIEVYPDHFAPACPADRVVNPHARKLVHDLLEADVEVLDLLPAMLAARETTAEPLYLAADPHWGPLGYAAAAKVTADRLKRYPFAVEAAAAAPVVKSTTKPFPAFETGDPHVSVALPALDPEQRKRAAAAHPKTYTHVEALAGGRTVRAGSPLMIIGNSYMTGYDEMLARDANTLLDNRAGGGQTTEAFADLLREPAALAATKVVLWVANTSHLVEFKSLPKPILDAAG